MGNITTCLTSHGESIAYAGCGATSHIRLAACVVTYYYLSICEKYDICESWVKIANHVCRRDMYVQILTRFAEYLLSYQSMN